MTAPVEISVVVPTRNRPQKLSSLLECLARQAIGAGYEIIVVDDGSDPPVALAADSTQCRVVRLRGLERSVARNEGAHAASGRLLVFLDDDLSFGSDLLQHHWNAFQEWPDALLVGAVRLPGPVELTPFGRFRARLESRNIPTHRGAVARPNFCTAQNLAIARQTFRDLDGFDPGMVSAEDQDLALRHTARGARLVFVPEAVVVHHDDAFDIRSYSLRAEWGMRYLGPFCRRHPDLSENVERERVNGPISPGREPLSMTVRKIVKASLASDVGTRALFRLAESLEAVSPDGRLVQRLYEIALGVHLRRGYLRQSVSASVAESRENSPSFRRAS